MNHFLLVAVDPVPVPVKVYPAKINELGFPQNLIPFEIVFQDSVGNYH
jgi:hypothetical protein